MLFTNHSMVHLDHAMCWGLSSSLIVWLQPKQTWPLGFSNISQFLPDIPCPQPKLSSPGATPLALSSFFFFLFSFSPIPHMHPLPLSLFLPTPMVTSLTSDLGASKLTQEQLSNKPAFNIF